MKRLRVGRARAFVRFLRDPQAGLFGKLFVVAAVAYVLCPIDLVPDAIPVLGWLDDLGVAGIAMGYVAKVIARYREEPQLAVSSLT